MIELYDTHAHFEPGDDIAAIIERARSAGVGRIMAVGGSPELNAGALKAREAGCAAVAIGYDRDQALMELPPLDYDGIDAVGEIALDYHYSPETREAQLRHFASQLEIAGTYGKPVVIHTRNAWEEMCAVVQEFRGRGLRGVFHAYSSDVACYEQLRECGDFLFGIGGVVTFKKSALAEVVAQMSLDDLLLETDCPYLTPAPHRGERNESSYTRFICEKIAALHNVEAEEVARRTTASAKRMFSL